MKNNIYYYIKKNIFILFIIIGLCPLLAISYAKFTINSESYRSNEMYISELLYSIKIDGENKYTVDVNTGDEEHIIEITSLNAVSTNYRLAYLNNKYIDIIYSSDYMQPAFGGITTKRTVHLTVRNTSDKTQTLSLMVFGGYSFNEAQDIKILDTYTPIDDSDWFYDYETTALYVGNERVEELDKTKYYTMTSYTCNNLADNEKVVFDSVAQEIHVPISKKLKCSLYFDIIESVVKEFNYTGQYAKLDVPVTGYYKLETWGAQGGNVTGGSNGGTVSGMNGGYGGYSVGVYYATKGETLYVYVGGKGTNNCITSSNDKSVSCNGGYNGGGNAITSDAYWYVSAGGGATHIAKKSGLLSTFETDLDNLLIVSGGGGGAAYYNYSSAGRKQYAGSGGGAFAAVGTSNKTTAIAEGGAQKKGFAFGKGGFKSSVAQTTAFPGGGAGFYGGEVSAETGAGGGSGYIGNPSLISTTAIQKRMYCYNCEQLSSYSTRTVSLGTESCKSETPTEDCSKIGNGYAKITYISYNEETSPFTINDTEIFKYTNNEQTYTVQTTGNYKLEVWGGQGGTASNLSGGYGGYSRGTYKLNKGDILYINVGGKGSENCQTSSNGTAVFCQGGYNGGGKGLSADAASYSAGGGGATDISLRTGTLDALSNYKSQILIVAGGGGGSTKFSWSSTTINGNGGHAGGYIGASGTGKNTSTGGTQSATLFGKGQSQTHTSNSYTYGGGGGGGYYGGNIADSTGGAGGSGYIGNSKLTNKVMYCYNCTSNDSESTKTISTVCTNAIPQENCSKQSSGYAKITLISK